jgi:hypothetical protein
VLIGIDPSKDGQPDPLPEILAPYREHPNVTLLFRPRRLGWAANIADLVSSVQSTWYAILPHDDLWHPRYLEILLTKARTDGVSVAYADLMSFGHPPHARKAVVLPPGEHRAEHLLRFCLQGLEAMPWRGVTRSDSRHITGGFPVDAHDGFAVECEYALRLLAAGRVIHVAEPLYLKRLHTPEVQSASLARLWGRSRDRIHMAWQHHAQRMRDIMETALTEAEPTAAIEPLIRLACETALLRRHQLTLPEVLPPAQRGLLDALELQVLEAPSCPWRDRCLAQILIAQAHEHQVEGDTVHSRQKAQQAWELDPSGDRIPAGLAQRLSP